VTQAPDRLLPLAGAGTRAVAPLDLDTGLASLAMTGRLGVAHEASREFGFGAEIAHKAAREGFWTLDAPVVRVGTPRVPPPYAPVLEQTWLLGPVAIRTAALTAVPA
jgi:2-oxoisovalerate dehydrogenase E1 component